MSAHYQLLDQQENVKVKVPRKSQYMEFVSAHKFETGNGKTVSVEDHWRSSSNINGQIVQRNFFGITGEQLGKNVIGRVEAQVKTTSFGKKSFLLISGQISRNNGQNIRRDLKTVKTEIFSCVFMKLTNRPNPSPHSFFFVL